MSFSTFFRFCLFLLSADAAKLMSAAINTPDETGFSNKFYYLSFSRATSELRSFSTADLRQELLKTTGFSVQCPAESWHRWIVEGNGEFPVRDFRMETLKQGVKLIWTLENRYFTILKTVSCFNESPMIEFGYTLSCRANTENYWSSGSLPYFRLNPELTSRLLIRNGNILRNVSTAGDTAGEKFDDWCAAYSPNGYGLALFLPDKRGWENFRGLRQKPEHRGEWDHLGLKTPSVLFPFPKQKEGDFSFGDKMSVNIFCEVLKSEPQVAEMQQKYSVLQKSLGISEPQFENGLRCLNSSPEMSVWTGFNTLDMKPDVAISANVPLISEIKLHAGRGEYECFPLAFRVNNREKKLTVSVIPPRSADFALTVKDVSVNPIGFVQGRYRNYADVLLPPGKITSTPRETSYAWVTLRIPEEAQPGEYLGSIQISGGAEPVEVPLRLRVWKFQLERNEDFPVIGILRFDNNIIRYDQRDPETLYREYQQRLVEHRFTGSGGVHPSASISIESTDKVNIDFSATAVGLRRSHADGIVHYQASPQWLGDATKINSTWLGISTADDNFLPTLQEVYRKLAVEYRKVGMMKNTYLYFIDEALPEFYPKLQAIASSIRASDQAWRIMTTFYHLKEPENIAPFIDIWCVEQTLFSGKIDFFHKEKQKGKSIWLYKNDFHLIDETRLNSRLYPWLLWKSRCDGVLFWGMEETGGRDPYLDQARSNGDGYLLYPDPSGGPMLDSIRFELLREGFEDFEYLRKLSAVAGSDSKNAQAASELLERAHKQVVSFHQYSENPADYEELRIEIGELLNNLR